MTAMPQPRTAKIALAVALSLLLVAGCVVVLRAMGQQARTHVTAYFANTNGVFPGDEVRILGVRVGKIDRVEPQPDRVRVDLWVDAKYKVPANASAAILSPALVTSRAIQLTPAYKSGPVLADNAVIPIDRTAVPMEWDDFRTQLQRLTETLEPTEPGGESTLGQLVSTAADNLRGQGADIRDTLIKLSQALAILGDHRTDIFATVENLSILVGALHDSADLLRQLNPNLAAVTALIANDPGEVGTAIEDINAAVGDVHNFVADNRETLGTTTDKLAGVTKTLGDSIDDIKQALHILPGTLSNFVNIYHPAQGSLTGALVLNNFANPIQFLCGAVQAASRLGAEQSAKLCVQYLAPILKNRQYNFPPLGMNLFVGATARPNELTYSEDWMRPDYVPPQPPLAAQPPPGPPLAAEQSVPPDGEVPAPSNAVQTNPSQGLEGMMVTPGGGS